MLRRGWLFEHESSDAAELAKRDQCTTGAPIQLHESERQASTCGTYHLGHRFHRHSGRQLKVDLDAGPDWHRRVDLDRNPSGG